MTKQVNLNRTGDSAQRGQLSKCDEQIRILTLRDGESIDVIVGRDVKPGDRATLIVHQLDDGIQISIQSPESMEVHRGGLEEKYGQSIEEFAKSLDEMP